MISWEYLKVINNQNKPCFSSILSRTSFWLIILALVLNLPYFCSTHKIPLKSLLSDLQYIGPDSRIWEGGSLCVNIEHIFLFMWQRVREERKQNVLLGIGQLRSHTRGWITLPPSSADPWGPPRPASRWSWASPGIIPRLDLTNPQNPQTLN